MNMEQGSSPPSRVARSQQGSQKHDVPPSSLLYAEDITDHHAMPTGHRLVDGGFDNDSSSVATTATGSSRGRIVAKHNKAIMPPPTGLPQHLTRNGGSSRSLVLAGKSRKRKVLDDDDYVDAIGRIIERDYFPETAKYRAQLEVLEQNEHVNFITLCKIYREVFSDDADFQLQRGNNSCSLSEINPGEVDVKHLSIDSFFTKYTSEDNASFEKLQRASMKEHRKKFHWVYENSDNLIKNGTSDQQKKAGMLMLFYLGDKVITAKERARMDSILNKFDPSSIVDDRKNGVEMGKFRVRNQLLFPPELKDSEDTCRMNEQPMRLLLPNFSTDFTSSSSSSFSSSSSATMQLSIENRAHSKKEGESSDLSDRSNAVMVYIESNSDHSDGTKQPAISKPLSELTSTGSVYTSALPSSTSAANSALYMLTDEQQQRALALGASGFAPAVAGQQAVAPFRSEKVVQRKNTHINRSLREAVYTMTTTAAKNSAGYSSMGTNSLSGIAAGAAPGPDAFSALRGTNSLYGEFMQHSPLEEPHTPTLRSSTMSDASSEQGQGKLSSTTARRGIAGGGSIQRVGGADVSSSSSSWDGAVPVVHGHIGISSLNASNNISTRELGIGGIEGRGGKGGGGEASNTFVSMTPTPVPMGNMTPIMTWGEVGGTPIAIREGVGSSGAGGEGEGFSRSSSAAAVARSTEERLLHLINAPEVDTGAPVFHMQPMRSREKLARDLDTRGKRVLSEIARKQQMHSRDGDSNTVSKVRRTTTSSSTATTPFGSSSHKGSSHMYNDHHHQYRHQPFQQRSQQQLREQRQQLQQQQRAHHRLVGEGERRQAEGRDRLRVGFDDANNDRNNENNDDERSVASDRSVSSVQSQSSRSMKRQFKKLTPAAQALALRLNPNLKANSHF